MTSKFFRSSNKIHHMRTPSILAALLSHSAEKFSILNLTPGSL